MLLVRSYRTFAPLPSTVASHQLPVTSQKLLTAHCSLLTVKGGMFLWHYPHARAHWALPSKFGLSGARTFLERASDRHRPLATASPTFSTALSSLAAERGR